MKNLFTSLLFLLCVYETMGQQRSEFLKEMNAAIENKKEVMKLLEKSGMLEHKEMGGLYRFKLEEIGSIKEKVVEQNFIINVYCTDENCFTVYRNDTLGTQVNNNAYFFTSAERANSFARNLAFLVNSYKTDGSKVTLELSLEGNTASTTNNNSQPDKDGLDEYLDAQEDNKNKTKSAETKTVVANDDDADVDRTSTKALEAKEHMEEIKANREEKKQQRKEEFDEKREQLKTEKEEQREKQREALAEKKAQVENSKTGNKRTKSDDEDAEISGLVKEETTDTDTKDKKNDALCKPLELILKSYASSQFKSIEGMETNTVKHINESKVKWKGARKSYLSNFRNKRTFIAELKSSKDFELLQVEYDELQTDLENCLGPDWDFTDKSNSDEYADFNGEVRDTEYHTSNSNTPTLRIILISDGDRYTLFVRIQ